MNPRCRSGLEVLLSKDAARLRGRKVGLVVNPTSVDANYNHSIDRLMACSGVEIVRLFGPEHGIRGDAQDMIAVRDAVDPRSGLPVVSLYGVHEDSLRPSKAQLEGLDCLVFDIQDIGSRYYTYVDTLAYCLEAAAEAGVSVIVLDRPNPLGGLQVEGAPLDMAYRSFVGRYPLPQRHGMTAGELAPFFVDPDKLDVDLEVIGCEGWTRGQYFWETGLPWVSPSPNMPTVEVAITYPGMCLLEGTNLSEGRGTTRPFLWMGAPWIPPYDLAEALAKEDIQGVHWRAHSFRPTFHKHAQHVCGGAEPHVVDPKRYHALKAGLAYILHCHRLSEDFGWRQEPYEYISDRLAIDLLAGGPQFREGIEAGASLEDLCAPWKAAEALFLEARQPFLLYGD